MHITKDRQIAATRRHGILAELRTGPYLATALPVHLHEELQVVLSENRVVSYGVKGTTTVSPLGSAFLIEPEAPHSAQVAVRQPRWGALRTLLIPQSSFVQYLGAAAARFGLRFATPVATDPMLMWDLCRTHRLITASSDQLARESAIVASLERLYLKTRQASSDVRATRCEDKMRRVRARLGSDLSGSLGLSEISAEVQLSPHHVLRQFRAVFGLSPHAFRTQLRLARARDLLLSRVSISDVAQMCGFSDHAHLTRNFHRTLGVPPSRYRNINFVQDERMTEQG